MKQKIALEILRAGRNVFLTGSAGTGKTYILNQYVKYLRERGIKPAVVAPTGIAASHLGGMTIHSFFGLGIMEKISDEYLKQLFYRRFLHNRLRNLKVLIVDEVSMVSPELFLSMDRILREFKHSAKPFGGIQIILSGDFFQLPPISGSGREERFAWQTDLWENTDLKVCYLEEKFRQDDPILINILDEIRSNNVSEESMEVFRSCYKKKLTSKFRATRLYTHNIDVDRINESELNKLSGEIKIFSASRKGSRKNTEKIFQTSLLTKELKLKREAVVIFIKNNLEKGYINGTLGRVVDFTEENLPVVEIFSGQRIVVAPEDWVIEDEEGNVKASVRQIPLRLAWALTIHKSQGMTLEMAEIDLSKTFEVGQGYVALSRIKSVKGLRLMGLNETALQVDEKVLVIDKEMREQSQINSLKWQEFPENERKTMWTQFITDIGGTTNEKKIAENRRKIFAQKKKEEKLLKLSGKTINKKSENREKGGTLNVTKKLLSKGKTIEEIATIRGLSRGTIVEHLRKMKELGLKIQDNGFKPKSGILRAVKRALLEVKTEKKPDNFLENGDVRLRAIFEKLNEKVSYDDIKLALLFLED